MIKLALKLALAALLANATYRVGSEYLTFIKFRDGVREAAIFKAATDRDLRTRIGVLAEEYDVPLDADDPQIERDGRLVKVHAAYRKPIELLPRYSVQWPFEVSLEVETDAGTLLPGAPPRR
jgi:hypothetical protein